MHGVTMKFNEHFVTSYGQLDLQPRFSYSDRKSVSSYRAAFNLLEPEFYI